MRNVTAKLACLLVMLALVLTGCSMVEIDQNMQLAEDMEKLEKEYSKVVVTYDGGEFTKGDLMGDYFFQYQYFASMYSYYYGMSVSEDEAENIAQSVAEGYVNTAAVLKKAEELGITLTEEEKAECAAYADEAYKNDYDTISGQIESDDEEFVAKSIEYNMALQGISYDYYYNQMAWDLILSKVEEAVIADAPVLTEAELNTRLAQRQMDDEAAYSQDLDTFEENMISGTPLITWMPSGYRTVKHILIKPETPILDDYISVRNNIAALNNELSGYNNEKLAIKNGEGTRTIEEVESDIAAVKEKMAAFEEEQIAAEEACIASVNDKITNVYGLLNAGQDFDSVMAEYGEDPGMTMDPAKTVGYYVCGASNTWDYSFRNAAMALEKVGDYSAEPVVSASGVHIIYYASDVEAGPVAIDDIREAFTAEAQEDANFEYFEAQRAEWSKAMNAKYNLDNFFVND